MRLYSFLRFVLLGAKSSTAAATVSFGSNGRVCVCVHARWSQFEADRRTLMIAINSIGTYLKAEDRLTLCPRLGRLHPIGQIMLTAADDYEQIRAVAERYPVSTAPPPIAVQSVLLCSTALITLLCSAVCTALLCLYCRKRPGRIVLRMTWKV